MKKLSLEQVQDEMRSKYCNQTSCCTCEIKAKERAKTFQHWPCAHYYAYIENIEIGDDK